VRRLAELKNVNSLFFSPDGKAYLWASEFDGRLVRDGKSTPLPRDTRTARFRAGAGPSIVLTDEDGVATWDPVTDTRKIVGGISPDDGVNITGDLVGDAVISLYYKKSGYQKETDTPKVPLP
jgi:hypothetical protein